MSTQYDDIGSAYDEMKKLPVAILECGNVKSALAPYIKGAKVLDLACGTGYYCRHLIEWGAARVVGVDVSQTMVNVAKQALRSDDRVSFHVGDCSVPVQYEGGPFDIVLGSWLLNYAANDEELINMYQNISINLKEGGHFVGVTPEPIWDPKTRVEQALASQPTQYEGIILTVKQEIEDGVQTHLLAVTKAGKVEFDGYYLSRNVYEESARAGGMTGTFSWKSMVIPEEREDRPKDVDDKSWEAYLKFPHFSILVISK